MSRATRPKYNFSTANDSHPLSIPVSRELHDRILTLCNITELTQTAICRYLLKRGVADMETRLVKLADNIPSKAIAK